MDDRAAKRNARGDDVQEAPKSEAEDQERCEEQRLHRSVVGSEAVGVNP